MMHLIVNDGLPIAIYVPQTARQSMFQPRYLMAAGSEKGWREDFDRSGIHRRIRIDIDHLKIQRSYAHRMA